MLSKIGLRDLRRMIRISVRIVVPIVLATLPLWGASALRTDPQGRVRAFLFGDVIEQYGSFNSYAVIQLDPAIQTTLVPTRPDYSGGVERARRNLRMYMPRTYERLVDDYDLLLTSDADRTVFTTEWIQWMADAVTDGGLGLEFLGSIGRSSLQERLDWSITPLGDIAPARTSDQFYKYGSFKVRIKDHDEELMRALPWESSPALANLDMQIPKEGSSVWAVTETASQWPLMTYWEVKRGAVLCFASKFPNGVMPWSRDWPLFPQAMIYLVYRISDKNLPHDHLLFQRLTSYFFDYRSGSSILISMLSFVERFGGSVDALYGEMDVLSKSKTEADEAYLEGDYDKSLELMDYVLKEQSLLVAKALRTKDRALVWIYLTEWFIVTATFLISGLVLWNLMMRKRLYREVGTSKLSS